MFPGKQLCWSLFFNKVAGKACNFIKKETPTQVFSCEYCEIFKKTNFKEHLCMVVSIPLILLEEVIYQCEASCLCSFHKNCRISPGAYSESYQGSKMGCLAKIINGFCLFSPFQLQQICQHQLCQPYLRVQSTSRGNHP